MVLGDDFDLLDDLGREKLPAKKNVTVFPHCFV